jgi:hypothetical protein
MKCALYEFAKKYQKYFRQLLRLPLSLYPASTWAQLQLVATNVWGHFRYQTQVQMKRNATLRHLQNICGQQCVLNLADMHSYIPSASQTQPWTSKTTRSQGHYIGDREYINTKMVERPMARHSYELRQSQLVSIILMSVFQYVDGRKFSDSSLVVPTKKIFFRNPKNENPYG